MFKGLHLIQTQAKNHGLIHILSHQDELLLLFVSLHLDSDSRSLLADCSYQSTATMLSMKAIEVEPTNLTWLALAEIQLHPLDHRCGLAGRFGCQLCSIRQQLLACFAFSTNKPQIDVDLGDL